MPGTSPPIQALRVLPSAAALDSSVASLSAAVVAIAVGMNFSFLNPQIHAPDVCARDSSINFRGAMFLPRYGEPAIRADVRNQLRAMHRSGFDFIRTIVAFGDRPSTLSDWFDTGHTMEVAPPLIATYLRDMAQAGISHAELAFSSQAGANPACRKVEWGDCFDRNSITRSIAFVVAVRKGINPTGLSELRFDLANESCVTPEMTRPLSENYQIYAKPLVSEYLRQFPLDRVTISCSIERFARARQELDETFEAAGRAPSFYEIHAYGNATTDIRATAAQLKATLGDFPSPLSIGETNYGVPDYTQSMLTTLISAGVPIRDVLFWPLSNSSNHCGVDVPAPYTRAGALGFGSRRGAKKH
jgi:hypothetical protein